MVILGELNDNARDSAQDLAPRKSPTHILEELWGSPGSSRVGWQRGRTGGERPHGREKLGQLAHINCPGLTVHELCDLRQDT